RATGVRITGLAAALVGALLLTALLRNLEPASTEKNDPSASAAAPSREPEANLLERSAPSINPSQPVLIVAPSTPLPPPADDRIASTTAPAFSMPQVAEDV